MEKERYCSICQRELSDRNPGTICIACQDNIINDLRENPYYDLDDMQHLLGLSAEQVKRLGRAGTIPGRVPSVKQHRYLKTEVDAWMHADYILPAAARKPTGPLQEEAYRLCRKKDHSWLVDERFLGHACTATNNVEIKDGLVQMPTTYRCYFCGHEEVQPLFQ
jgi:hypothetical protein